MRSNDDLIGQYLSNTCICSLLGEGREGGNLEYKKGVPVVKKITCETIKKCLQQVVLNFRKRRSKR